MKKRIKPSRLFKLAAREIEMLGSFSTFSCTTLWHLAASHGLRQYQIDNMKRAYWRFFSPNLKKPVDSSWLTPAFICKEGGVVFQDRLDYRITALCMMAAMLKANGESVRKLLAGRVDDGELSEQHKKLFPFPNPSTPTPTSFP